MKIIQQIYEEGWKAREAKDPLYCCPYVQIKEKHSWKKGWLDCDAALNTKEESSS